MTLNPFPELLVPAGDYNTFKAAITSGADAVYLGIGELNARRRARNFSIEQLPQLVEEAHQANTKVYLTLNIDLKDRELRQAATLLQEAERAKVDAILIRDPALLLLKKEFPNLFFHFSTQACITSRADAQAAKELGISRVVVARECNLKEIKKIAEVGVETEVFVQGALCYCVSGRCLLSSWGGGRSGNRGCCTSPCRVPWGVNEAAQQATPLSMSDLGLIDHLKELREAGVCCLKIEGRLKTADWVSKATQLYHEALDELDLNFPRQHLATELGNYTGRPLSDAYLRGEHQRLTGTWGRESIASTTESTSEEEIIILDDDATLTEAISDSTPEPEITYSYYDLQIMKTEKGLCYSCTLAGQVTEWTLPLSDIRRPEKAITIKDYLNWLKDNDIDQFLLKRCRSNIDRQLLAPRTVNFITNQLTKLFRQLKKAELKKQKSVSPLSDNVKEILVKGQPNPKNQKPLSPKADTVRLTAEQALPFADAVKEPFIVVEQATPKQVQLLAKSRHRQRFIIALPAVFFDDQQAPIEALIQAVKKAQLPIEVNSWGGWFLAKKANLTIHGGPGLGIFNHLAAQTLDQLGFRTVYYTIEADRQMLESTSDCCSMPTSMIIYGRIPLMFSRAEQPQELMGKIWQDRRDIHMIPRVENHLLTYRTAEPFSLLRERNEHIKVAHLVYDFISEPNPIKTWQRLTSTRPAKSKFTFNYNRDLE